VKSAVGERVLTEMEIKNLEIRIVHEANYINEFLKDKPSYDYIYQLNNLAPEIWQQVICYGLFAGEQMLQIAMMNMNYQIPVLLAAGFDNKDYSKELVSRIKPFLPAQFYTHIDQETVDEVFTKDKVINLAEYLNMGFCNDHLLTEGAESNAMRLGVKELSMIKELLEISYPEAWLDDELVALNENFGIFSGAKLISFAGIHAYSEQFAAAAIAHVTTHPEYRSMGYGEEVVVALIKSLRDKIKFIGLNVRADNFKATNCYRKIGFVEYGKFVACEIIINN